MGFWPLLSVASPKQRRSDDKKGGESRGRGRGEGKGRVRKRDVEGRECIGKESDRRRRRR